MGKTKICEEDKALRRLKRFVFKTRVIRMLCHPIIQSHVDVRHQNVTSTWQRVGMLHHPLR